MEDGEDFEEAEEFPEEEVTVTDDNLRPAKRCYFHCQRIDELATPNRRMFLALWKDHVHHLPQPKIDHLKGVLQELYALTPEETIRYLADLKEAARAREFRKRFKQHLRKILRQKRNAKSKAKAFRHLRKVLICGMKYATMHEIPPIVSARLRYLSDIILEQLCELRQVDVPDRDNPDLDKLANLLVTISDWMAIAMERVFYTAQLKKNPQYAHNMDATGQPEADTFVGAIPIAASTPRQSLQDN